jgi:dolichol-phosphate mannosyltransferase
MTSTPRHIRAASISIVVPVFNEAPVLPELRRRLTTILEDVTPRFEVLLIDDGSTDGTAELADRIHGEDARFKCVHFSRNFGHQAAVTAGLRYATGDVTCVMDADLQDPPEVLLSLFAEWEKGGDAVYAVRRNRKEHQLKVGLYKLFYRLLSRLASIRIPLDAGDFCLLSREVREEINRLPEKERFVRGLRAWVGYSQVGVEYDRQARRGGESKYTFVGLLRLAINGIVSFSDKPLIYLTVFGLGISAIAFLYGTYLVVVRLLHGDVVTGYASLMSGLLFLSGLQLMAMGVLGIYVSKIFQEVKARPTYVVRSLRGISNAPTGDEGRELERAR